MGWVHPEIMCMMHPDEKNHPGVCSSCLREKLKKLPGLPFTMDQPNSLPSPTRYSSCSSASSSVCLSPNSYNKNHHPGHRRVSSNVVTVGEKGVFVISGGGGGRSRMGKSRSVAASVKRKRVRNNVVAGSKKKEGFWSKLIRSTSMKTRCVFVQSKHAKE